MRLPLLVVLAAALAVAITAESFGAAATRIDGTAMLKPIKGSTCKVTTGKVQGKNETDIACQDIGLFQGSPRNNSGTGYSWRWTSRPGEATKEVGNLLLNFGKGTVLLSVKGTFRSVGKATKTSAVALTKGTWRVKSGTGAYKGVTGSGSYRLDLRRNATVYKLLKVTLSGTVR